MSNLHNSRPGGGGGGGGVLGMYIGGGLRCGHSPKGGLGAGTAQKGGSRCAYTPQKKGGGVLGAGTARKRGVLGPGVLGTSNYNPGQKKYYHSGIYLVSDTGLRANRFWNFTPGPNVPFFRGGLRCGHSQKKGGLRPRGLRYVYNF